ncbi:exonuclease domain-containing protein [Halobacillus yeomjeoni]|uniref:3'-5' exoribonuclease n=1 Tax=Halobacillus yeomjeoni TaxID=311194 RepID=A0A931HTF7_9BACI|nr:exonuclease domain-containing protein [Halobacillus yeomjeoni]MBH0229472.1 3'-5' exoribonuclease [Halobacillus yeomjeoni]
MNFVALDFETANSSRGSVCSIGLVEYENGRLKDEYYRLVKPKKNYFAPVNVSIHGITKQDVGDSHEFDVLWEQEIQDRLEGKFLIAHNAQFDMGVLRSVLDLYDLPYPMLAYNCTLNISKKTWTLHRYNLKAVSDHLGIQFDHHHALDDARAAAHIFLHAANHLDASDAKELVDKTGTINGMMYDKGYEPARLNKGKRASKPVAKTFTAATTEFDRSHPYYGASIVFTGKLKSLKREEAIQHVIDVGGRWQNNVESTTNFVVVGPGVYKDYLNGKKTSKLERVEMLLSQGHSIEIVTEEQFMNKI